MTDSPEIDGRPSGARFRDSLLGILASTHSLPEIFDRFAEVLEHTLRLDLCVLYRLLDAGRAKILCVRTSYPDQRPGPGRVLRLNSDHLRILAEGIPATIDDLLEAPSIALSPEAPAEGIRSLLIVPIHYREEPLGMLVVGSRRAGAFAESALAPVQAAAQLLGMVMAHENLSENIRELAGRRTVEMEQSLEETAALLEISRLLLERRELRPTFERVAGIVVGRFGYGCCDILLWDERKGELVLEAATGREAPPTPVTTVLGRGIVGTAAAEHGPIVVPQVDRDPRYIRMYAETRSEMAIPMLAGERLLGVINVESPHPDAFSERDVELVRSIAQQISLWVENRLLLAQREAAEKDARAKAAELERINAELTRALEELQSSRAQLVQAEKLAALGTLLSGAAHELNNPLAVVQGYAELLLGQSLPPALRQRLEMIYEQARRAGQIVEGLLRLARPSPARKTEAQACFPAQAIEDALALRAAGLAQGNIQLRVTLDRTILVPTDAEELQEVVLHLLRNAEEAVCDALRKEITVELCRRGEQAELLVADTGPGMAEAVLPRVFDPFFTTKPVGSAGLGLSVSYGIVTARGGAIRAANRPEGGAVFTVLLPALGASEQEGGSGTAGHILVLATDEATRFLLQEILIPEEYRVTSAASPEEAWDRLAAAGGQPPGAMICDRKFLAEVRRRGLTIPLILVADEGEPPVEDCALLFKPFRMDEVRRVVRKVLGPAGDPGAGA